MNFNLQYNKIHLGNTAKLSILIIAITALRGILVLIINIPSYSSIIYYSISLTILLVSVFPFITYFRKSNLIIDRNFHHLLALNFFSLLCVGILTLIIDIHTFSIEILYLSVLPFIIYYFIKIPEQYVIFLLGIISTIIAFSIIIDFFALNSLLPSISQQKAFDIRSILRFDAVSFSHTEGVYRAAGILADPHDSGNLMGLLSIFWMAFYLRTTKRRVLYIILLLITFFALLLTQSAVNIIMTISILGILFSNIIIKNFINSILIVSTVLILVVIFNEYLPVNLSTLSSIWLNRVDDSHSEGWQGMTGYGIRNFPMEEAIHIFIGQAKASNALIYRVEAVFLKHLYDLGIISFTILYTILIYPIFQYFKWKNKNKILVIPYVYSIIFGIMSTIHYGSIFRIPNIIIFYLMFAMFFKLKSEVIQSEQQSCQV